MSKVIFTVCNYPEEDGFDWKAHATLIEAIADVKARWEDLPYKDRERLKRADGYYLISKELEGDDGEPIEYIDSIEAFYYKDLKG